VKLCCNACTLGGVPFGTLSIARQIEATKAAGFPLIGLDIKAIDAFVADGGAIAEIRRLLDAASLPAFEIHPLRCGVGLNGVAAEFARVADIGAALGVSWLCATATGAVPDNPELVKQVQSCADICAARNIGLGIEFQPWLSVGTPSQAKALVIAVARTNVGIVVDPFHFYRGCADLAQLRQLRARDIAFVQFCDCGAPEGTAFEDMGSRRLPGEGVFPLQEFAQALADTGFDGVVECEVQSAELRQDLPESIANRVYAASQPFWRVGQ
jgi:sugar phosphate isomerase/epimerase